MRPRIAVLAPRLDNIGGQEVQGYTLIEALRREDYDVTFIPINPTFPRSLQWLRGYPYVRTILNQALYLPSLLRLRCVDVAHIFSASYWSFLLAPVPALLVARTLGKRVVLNYHSGEAEDHLKRWGRLVHPWLSLVDEIVVPSRYLQNVFARHGYSVRVIRNLVDASYFQFRERAPLRPNLLSTRNLEPYYRVDITVRAFALIKARYPEATLTVAGYGSEEGRLRSLAHSLGCQGLRFVGRVDRQDIARLYDGCDIFVNSSVVDNQPVSILEAFAAGLPVVSTGTGDITGMLKGGESGVLVPHGDPPAIARAVSELLDHPERALAITRRARQEIDKHTWPRVREEWAAVYAGSHG